LPTRLVISKILSHFAFFVSKILAKGLLIFLRLNIFSILFILANLVIFLPVKEQFTTFIWLFNFFTVFYIRKVMFEMFNLIV